GIRDRNVTGVQTCALPILQGRIFLMMKFLQKLGKSLMLPVAVLPICGLLMGIGYFLCPSTMQGGTVEGLAQIIGFLLVKAGGAQIGRAACRQRVWGRAGAG